MSIEDVAPDNDEPAAAAPVEAAAASDDEQRVPLDRFRTVTSENKELRNQLDELSKWKEEQEQAALTELERERNGREKAEQEASEAVARANTLERSTWIRSAAAAAGFTDPEDAVGLIGTSDIDDADLAAKQVAALADKKPHLISQSPSAPSPIGAPLKASAPNVDPDDPRAGLGSDILSFIRNK
jgi:hypothetical protein